MDRAASPADLMEAVTRASGQLSSRPSGFETPGWPQRLEPHNE